MKKTNLVFFFLIFASQFLFSNIFSSYKKVSVVKTKYFDVIFPSNSTNTADKIIQNADNLFDCACEEFQLEKKFRMPIVITKDSDKFSAEYTPAPYNRIIIYDGIPAWNNPHEDKTLFILKKAIIEAVASSKKNKFWQFASSLMTTDAIQPVTLLNIPTNFMIGVCEIFANDNTSQNQVLINDKFSLQLLSQAKADNNFPTWIDATGAADIFQNKTISKVAMTAFVAYIQQEWGIEKFIEFWNECGRVNFFYITAGIFKKVYQIPIAQAWNNFKDSIPTYSAEVAGSLIFTSDFQSEFKFIQSSPYGIIYYDGIKKQVILIQNNKKKILFIASGVQNLTISPNGEYLAVSYEAEQTHSNLSKNKVRVYNLMEQVWIEKTHTITNGSFIYSQDEKLLLVGTTKDENNYYIKGFTLFNPKEEAFSYPLQQNYIPQNIISIDMGIFFYFIQKKEESIFYLVNTNTKEVKTYSIPYSAKDFKLSKIKSQNPQTSKLEKAITFTYAPKDLGMPSKMGYFLLNKPEQIFLQTNTFSGGINDSIIQNDTVYFYSNKTIFQELRKIDFSQLTFEEHHAQTTTILQNEQEQQQEPVKHIYNKYNPLPYLFKGTWIPFFPISLIDFYGYQTAPGLGFTYLTSTDPLEQIQGSLSFCAGFADPLKNYTEIQEAFTLAAYGKTTMFPIELTAGGIWYFDTDGRYNLRVLTGERYKVPVGMSFQNLYFSLQQLWDCSTEYTDIETGVTTKLEDWPSVNDAFNKFSMAISAEYNNYHQAGLSPYQQLGFETNASFVTVYDFEKIKKTDTLNWNEPSQLKFTIELGLKLPYLIPIFDVENWTICFPVTIFSQFNGEEGTACHSFAEVLLAGYEIQSGIPGVNLYLQRFGTKLGYDIAFEYEALNIANPDIRDLANIFNALTSSQIDDFIYFNFQIDLSPVVGKSTSTFNMTAGVQFEFHLRKNESKISALIKTNL